MTPATALPVAISCGEPAGIGPEIAAKAWAALRGEVPLFWIGDPAHLPADVPVVVIDDPSQAAGVMDRGLPVLSTKKPCRTAQALPIPVTLNTCRLWPARTVL